MVATPTLSQWESVHMTMFILKQHTSRKPSIQKLGNQFLSLIMGSYEYANTQHPHAYESTPQASWTGSRMAIPPSNSAQLSSEDDASSAQAMPPVKSAQCTDTPPREAEQMQALCTCHSPTLCRCVLNHEAVSPESCSQATWH